eukprot:7723100-Pyramimonas_sp.AAC.2
MSKQGIAPVLSGPGSGTYVRDRWVQRVAFPAPRSVRARYFGGRVGANCSCAVEYAHRKKAAAAAHYSFGALWP